ncbi:MAG: hypothetical protein ACI358_01540 [Candidatus Limimorpha sp.]
MIKPQHEQNSQAEKIWYYPDGGIMEILYKDGTDVWYFSNGKKWKERRTDGSVKTFYPDGTPRELVTADGFRYYYCFD